MLFVPDDDDDDDDWPLPRSAFVVAARYDDDLNRTLTELTPGSTNNHKIDGIVGLLKFYSFSFIKIVKKKNVKKVLGKFLKGFPNYYKDR